MGKPLIIVESPAKAATIKKYLAGQFEVEASAGHIKDLPEKTLGVDIEDGFKPKFVVVKGKKKLVDKLREAADGADRVLLATDPDREGEAIAWHIAEEIKKSGVQIERVLFHEITKDAIKKAIEHPRELDALMYDSQLARRILDRLVGYQISPLLWRKVQGGLSAGRVQSVAVRLVVDRERDVEAFNSEEYWILTANLGRSEARGGQVFKANLRRLNGEKAKVSSGEQAEAVAKLLESATFSIQDVVRKDRPRRSSPPFITSTLQQEASRLLHFSPAHTMGVAQRLYEGVDAGDEGRVGLITYMRTDSVRSSADAVSAAREMIKDRWGDAYLPSKPNVYKNKRSAQDAHEAIRPTSVHRTPETVKNVLGRDELRLYTLIYTRFLASQMAPAVFDQTTVDVVAGPAEFRATGSVLRFEGFLAAIRTLKAEVRTVEPTKDVSEGEDEVAEEEDTVLPGDLEVGEGLDLRRLDSEQKFTEPPPRFSEATLVRELEERGIGRPSTYATIVSTIQTKGYVNKVDGKLRPSELGRVVNDLLVDHFTDIVDFDFTARMELDLDEVEEGRLARNDLLVKFYDNFSGTLEKAVTEMRSVKADAIPAGVDCDKCGKPMLIRFGKNGAFLGCSGFPDCKNTREFDRDDKGRVVMREVEDVGSCPDCGSPLQVRSGRFGKFIACTSYPECKFTRPYARVESCPVDGCKGHLVERVSKRQKRFFSCSEYPACKFITSYEPLQEECPQCKAPTLFVRIARGGRSVVCQREGCDYRRRLTTGAKAVAG